jgi:hypothetical protein
MQGSNIGLVVRVGGDLAEGGQRYAALFSGGREHLMLAGPEALVALARALGFEEVMSTMPHGFAAKFAGGVAEGAADDGLGVERAALVREMARAIHRPIPAPSPEGKSDRRS